MLSKLFGTQKKLNRSHVKNLLAMMAADGEATKEELAIAAAVCAASGIPAKDSQVRT